MHVLRKSYGPYSAGTEVEVQWDGKVMYGMFIGELDIPSDVVVQRRSRSMMVPLTNSRERRKARKAAANA